MEKVQITSQAAPAAIGPYSQAVRIGDLVYTSGQLPVDVATGEIAEGGIEGQTHMVFKNIKAVLQEAGTSLAKVVKATVFLKDMNDFAAMNGIYASYFPSDAVLPARSAVQVARLPKDVMIEIEVIAIL
ncbi:RidA family protein [Pleomorphochaeta sp. DL1XJH-081]|jgi:2-iminobutanoate/2-iminopropanoate deaminase|uniref:RidA family protein n=1 Tax=Pleomorphochaeta sp. DL1XJH-081 TaxID=3409690 RepID=UPI003BB77E80